MKLIIINEISVIAEKHSGMWYCRHNDTLIILPTIKELKTTLNNILSTVKEVGNNG